MRLCFVSVARLSVALALALALASTLGACATSPAMRSPLRERLASADTPTVEDAARACLGETGWTRIPIGSVSGGSNVVSAKNKAKEQTQVFIHPPDQLPRITGGPDNEMFWKCLGGKLSSGAADDKASPHDPGDKDGGAS